MVRHLVLAGLLFGASAMAARASSVVDLTNDNSVTYKPFGSPFAIDMGPSLGFNLGGGLTLTATASELLGSVYGGGTAAKDVGQSEFGLGVFGTSGLPNYVDNFPVASLFGAETLTLTFSSAVTLDSAKFFTVAPPTQVAINGAVVGSLPTNGTTSLALGLTGTSFAFTVPAGINDAQWSYALTSVSYTAGSPGTVGGPSGTAVPLPPAALSGMGTLGLLGAVRMWKRRAS